MKILVPIKRVVDYNVQVRPTDDGRQVELAGVKMSPNPFDENALEEALRLKEAGLATEIVAVTFGNSMNQDVLRHALAMGVDRAILVDVDKQPDSLGVAKLLKAIVKRETPQLVLMGKQAIDYDAGQTPQMLAGLLGWPQGTFVSKVEFKGEQVEVTREIDGGTETLKLQLPVVISVDLRLNSPRFVKLPNLMMAKKKPIETLNASELVPNYESKLKTLGISYPPSRKPAQMLTSVDELIGKLKNEAGVL